MNKNTQTVNAKNNRHRKKGTYSLEINNKQDKGCIEVWLTNEEQEMYDKKQPHISVRLGVVTVSNDFIYLSDSVIIYSFGIIFFKQDCKIQQILDPYIKYLRV